MKLVHLLLVGILLASAASGQSIFFISIDSDDRELFRVSIGKKSYTSDGFGHLVIPHLINSTYMLKIDFPSGKYDQHIFSVELGRHDRGFQMKKKDARNWVLFDWQRLELVYNVQNERALPDEKEGRRTDEFARLMAAVVNDSSVMILSDHDNEFLPPSVTKVSSEGIDYGKKIPLDTALKVNVDLGKGVVKTDNKKTDSLIGDTGQASVLKASESVRVKEQIIRKDTGGEWQVSDPVQGQVNKILDNTDKEFRKQIFRDSSMGGVDSILIKIPLEAPTGNQTKILPEIEPSSIMRDSSFSLSAQKDTSVKTSRLVMINSDCRFFATDEDLDKLRVKMMETEEPGGRIEAARRVMRNRCFSTRQVRALTELFNSDEYRYRFFEACYPYVSDTDEYRELIVFLTDEYLKARFKALVRY